MHKYAQSTNRRIPRTIKSTNLLPFSCFVRQSHPLVISFDCWIYLLLFQPWDPTPRSSAFHGKIAANFHERTKRGERRSQRRDKVHGMSPSGLISQTNADDWMLACRKMDRSLWITDYPPPSFHLVLRSSSFRCAAAVSNCPLPPDGSSFLFLLHLSFEAPLHLRSQTRTESKRERERPIRTGSTGNLPHAYVRCLSFLLWRGDCVNDSRIRRETHRPIDRTRSRWPVTFRH